MAHGICLQDWTTITGATSAVVTQDERDWIEVPEFQDAAFYCEVSNANNSVATHIDVQTSPTRDESFFVATPAGGNPYVARFDVSTASSFGVQNLQFVRWAAATTTAPLGRFLRWKITFPSGGPTVVTFRIWVSLNQAGWA